MGKWTGLIMWVVFIASEIQIIYTKFIVLDLYWSSSSLNVSVCWHMIYVKDINDSYRYIYFLCGLSAK